MQRATLLKHTKALIICLALASLVGRHVNGAGELSARESFGTRLLSIDVSEDRETLGLSGQRREDINKGILVFSSEAWEETLLLLSAQSGGGTAQDTCADSGPEEGPCCTDASDYCNGGPEVDAPVAPNRDEQSQVDVRPNRVREGRYQFEFGTIGGYRSDLFPGTGRLEPEPVFITTLSGSLKAELTRSETSRLTGEVRFRHHIFEGVSGANSSDLDLALDYRLRGNRFRVKYFTTPRRLASIDDDETGFHSSNRIKFQFSRPLTRRIHSRVSYEFDRRTFQELPGRNSAKHELSADLRYKIHDLFRPGVGFELERVNRNLKNRKDAGLVLLLESRIKDRVRTRLRYRYNIRHYLSVPSTSRDFEREDRRQDIRIYVTVKLTKQWSLFLYNSFLNNVSSRAGRSFNVNESGVGIFFSFRLP